MARKTTFYCFLACLAPAAVLAAAGEGDFVPFVIPAKVNPKSEILFRSRPVGPGDWITAKAGHFFRGKDRYRVWGVNLCFGACFPTHDEAREVAERLAAFGVNSVRFHHMDMQSYPGGIWDRKDPRKLSADALDRLDFFLDQLARRGIYANVNLHVSRTHSAVLGLPKPGTQFDKMVGIFTPKLVAAQKAYARDLLTHVNPYRPGKPRYADDPAISFVEITNEDSFFMWSAARTLRGLPDYYAKLLQGLYNEWLKKRYGTTRKLAAAWSAGAQPLGRNLLADPKFELPPAKGPDAPRWHCEQHEGCRAQLKKLPGGGVRFEIAMSNQTNWHLQFNQARLKVAAGQYYTLTFRARAEKPREISVNVTMAHEPWGNLGLSGSARLGPTWQTFRLSMVAGKSDDNARVSFLVGASDISPEFAEIAFQPGGRFGLGEGESIEKGTVALFGQGEVPQRMTDRMRFLAETEKAYFDDLYAYIRKDLGSKALITGTIVFGPLGLWAQSDMDFVDGHAYWHHPHFPGRPWDAGNWTVDTSTMTDNPDRAVVMGLSAQRLLGKPYTVSEYNHPAPQPGQAECVPLLAAWAAAQDWDGVWFFTYSHSTGNWDRKHYASFFDFCGNPAKWGFMPAGTVIFREFGMPPLKDSRVVPLAPGKDSLADLTALHLKHDRDMLAAAAVVAAGSEGSGWRELLRRRAYTALGKPAEDNVQAIMVADDDQPLARFPWKVQGGKGAISVWTAGAGVTIGAPYGPRGGGDFMKPEFVTMASVPLDGQPVEKSRRILLTACGRCENEGMVFSENGRTVGRNWGRPPVRIEAVTIKGMDVDRIAGNWRCHALAPDGTIRAEVPDTGEGDAAKFTLSPKYKTMWYLLTRTPAQRGKGQ